MLGPIFKEKSRLQLQPEKELIIPEGQCASSLCKCNQWLVQTALFPLLYLSWNLAEGQPLGSCWQNQLHSCLAPGILTPSRASRISPSLEMVPGTLKPSLCLLYTSDAADE